MVLAVAELALVVVVVSLMLPFNLSNQPLHYIPCTCNTCKWFFCLAKLAYSGLRKDLKHTTLEMLLFLCFNNHFWDMEMVQPVVRDKCNDVDFDKVSDEE